MSNCLENLVYLVYVSYRCMLFLIYLIARAASLHRGTYVNLDREIPLQVIDRPVGIERSEVCIDLLSHWSARFFRTNGAAGGPLPRVTPERFTRSIDVRLIIEIDRSRLFAVILEYCVRVSIAYKERARAG